MAIFQKTRKKVEFVVWKIVVGFLFHRFLGFFLLNFPVFFPALGGFWVAKAHGR